MADQVITLRIRADGSAAVAGVKKVERELGGVGRAGSEGGRQASRGLRDVETSSDRAGKSINKAKGYLLGFVGAAAAVQAGRGIIRMADEYTNLASKIKLVTDSEEEAARVQKQVFAVAQETRSGLQSTGDLYVKLARSTRDMNLSQQKVLGITKTINQSFIVSGASAEEANAAIIQLGQGLASGALRGDKFNSVAEQAPIIMDLLAEHLNMTRGELRAFAAEGKITAKTVVDALSGGAQTVEEQYDQMQITIAGAMQKVKNAVAQSIGEASASTGGANALANAINAIAENMDSVINATVLLGKIVVAMYVGKLLKNGAAWITSLKAQTTETVALGNASAAASAKQVTGIKSSITQVGKLRAAGSLLMAAFTGWSIGTYLRDQFVEVRVAGLAFVGALLKGWEHVKYGFQVGIESIVFAFKKSAEVVLRYISNALADMAVNAASIPGIGGDLSGKLLNMARALQPTISATKNYETALAALAREHAANVNAIDDNITGLVSYELAQDGAKESADSLSKSADSQGKHLQKLAKDQADTAKVAANFAKQLEETQLRLSGLSTDQATYVLTIRDLRDQYDRWIAAGADAADAQLVLNQRVADANEAFHKAKTGAKDYADELPKVSHEVDAMSQIVDRSAQSMADAFAGWMTGTLSKGKSFAKQMVDLVKQMVAQMIAQWAKMKVFGPLLSGLMGTSGAAYGGTAGGGGGFWSSLFGTATNYATNKAASSLIGSGGDAVATGNGGGFGQLFDTGRWANSGRNMWSGFQTGWQNYLNGGGAQALGKSSMFGSYSYAGGVPGYNYGGGMPGITGPAQATYQPSTLGYVGAGLTGAYMGYNRWQNSGKDAGGALGAAAYGVGGYYGATAVGAAMAGGISAGLAAIPIVGWIALAAILVDKVSGGKLFGTKFRAKELSTRIDLASQGEVTGTVMKEKQKAFFGGREQRTYDRDVSPEAQAAGASLYKNIQNILDSVAGQIGVATQEGLDASLEVKQKLSKKGKVKSTDYIVEWMGQTWTEATEEAANQRLGADAILTMLDKAFTIAKTTTTTTGGAGADKLGGLGDQIRGLDDVNRLAEQTTTTTTKIVGEASDIARRWQDDAAQLADGANFLLAAATDLTRGTALLADTGPGSLTAITGLVTGLAQQDEALAQTYTRLKAETQTYETLLATAGVTTDKTREELVRFADSMANAAGGLQNLQQLTQAFTQAYYGAGSQLTAQIDLMRQQVTGQLGALGLDAATSMDQFRAAYEAALPTMSEQQVLQWMQAGVALSQLNQAMDQLAAQQDKYQAWMDGIYQTIGAAFDQPWTRQFAQLDEELHGMINQANALARAAGKAGASEKDLAAIHEYMAQKAAAMIAALKQDTLSLASQLYGGAGGQTLDQLNAQIAALQAGAGNAAGGIQQAVQSITDSASLLIGDLSPYNDRQKLDIAKQQLISGQASKEDVLRIAQRLFASTSKYKEVFDWVQAHGPTQRAGAGGYGGAGGGQNNAGQLAELIKQRDALQEQQRFGQAQQLASNIAQMATVTGDSFETIAEEIKRTNKAFSLDKLAKDLGITDIDAYLSKLQDQDLPGSLGSMTDTLVQTLNELGANLIAAITGYSINQAASAQPLTGENQTPPAPGGTATIAPLAPVSINTSKPLAADPAMLQRLDALAANMKSLEAKFDENGKINGRYLPRIAENTERGADGTETVARNTHDLVAERPAEPRSTRSPRLPVGA